MNIELLECVKFDEKGLVTVVIQDHITNQVLMLAYMNKESLKMTLESGKCTYWSRSRQKLWLKGETSGHFQYVKSIHIDCDGDAILIKAEQVDAACHTGEYSCFYRQMV